MNKGKPDEILQSQNKFQKGNVFSKVSTTALTGIMIVIAGGAFYLGNLMGKRTNNVQSIELKRTVTKQQQTIKHLNDTILIMKLNKKDIIPSLQDPTRDTP
jgi:hypothetical protein